MNAMDCHDVFFDVVSYSALVNRSVTDSKRRDHTILFYKLLNNQSVTGTHFTRHILIGRQQLYLQLLIENG